jgi:L-threonylcarbamoyladenylate synthase
MENPTLNFSIRNSSRAGSTQAEQLDKCAVLHPKPKILSVANPESDPEISAAAALIRDGRLVVFPTETVYGIGADATSDSAVAAVFAAKQRPEFNPLIIHIASVDVAPALVEFSDIAARLAEQFWPGALSLILPRRADCPVSLLAGAGLDTLALRVPDHKIAQALLAAAGRPIAAPSANRSGEVSPTRAAHVADSLGSAVELILDGGPCRLGVESTVLDLTGDIPAILRPGGVSREALEDAIGPVEVSLETGPKPSSPGMLASHYAPRLPLRTGVNEIRKGEALLSFGRHELTGFAEECNLSPNADLGEAAANLFAMMRELDRPEFAGIAAMTVPDQGLGRAINDRLNRAAAPR